MRNKADQSRLDAIHDMPCLACVSMRVSQPFPTEAHHLVDKGYRKHSGGDQSTAPLCQYHHRGVILDGWTSRQMEAMYGPSMALNKRLFTTVFGGQRELLDDTNKLLGVV